MHIRVASLLPEEGSRTPADPLAAIHLRQSGLRNAAITADCIVLQKKKTQEETEKEKKGAERVEAVRMYVHA